MHQTRSARMLDAKRTGSFRANRGVRKCRLYQLTASKILCSVHPCSKMAVAGDCLSRATIGTSNHAGTRRLPCFLRQKIALLLQPD
jgi:hypothetical protein